MPGNKNSGRKKKPIECEDVYTDDLNAEKRTVGRPRKTAATVVAASAAEYASSQESKPLLETKTIDIPTRTKHNPSDLKKRTSSINRFYDEFLGPPHEVFPSSKLPLKRVVLQRYRSLRSKSYPAPQNEITSTITNDLLQLWRNNSILFDTYRSACKVVQGVITNWVDATNEDRKSAKFQKNLGTLLDLQL